MATACVTLTLGLVSSAPGLRERKKQRVRETLEKEGIALFTAKGYDSTTVEDITEASDVSTRTFFRYFETKDQLLFADHPRRIAALTAALQGSDNLSVDTIADAVVDFFTENLAQTADRFRLELRVAADHHGLRATLYKHQSDLVDVVAGELRRRRLARSLEAQMIASAIMVAVREMSMPWLVGRQPDLGAQLAEARDRLHQLGPLASAH
jgi:AcrR family transcriptional regulator